MALESHWHRLPQKQAEQEGMLWICLLYKLTRKMF